MKSKKRYSIWVKVVLMAAFLISLTAATISSVFLFYGTELGAFYGIPFVESDIANELARRGPRGYAALFYDDHVVSHSDILQKYIDEKNQTMLDIYTYYQYLNNPSPTATYSQTPEFYQSLYEHTNIRARVVTTDEQGNMITTICALGDAWDTHTVLVDRMRDPSILQPMWFEIGFDRNVSNYRDPLGQTARLYHILSENQGLLVVWMVSGSALSLITMILLLLVAGHRPNDSDIHLRLFDRWALALVLGILCAGWSMLYLVTEEQVHLYSRIAWNPKIFCINMMLLIWGTVVVGFLTLRTIIVRCKAHRFWNTTLCYYVCAPIWRLMKKYKAEKQTARQETQLLGAGVVYSKTEDMQPSSSLNKEIVQGTAQDLAQKTQGTVWQAVNKAKDFEWKGSRVQGIFKRIWNGCCAFASRLRGAFSRMDVVTLGMLCGILVVSGYLFIINLFSWYEDRFIMTCIFSGLVLIGLFFILRQISSLQAGAQKLAEGVLTHKVDTHHLHGPFRVYAEYLNNISSGMMVEVERRMKSERLKTELLTNVSHDIKTPLTSIINYVDLMKKLDVQPEEAKEYADVLERQSYKLKKLLEDLIEASKAATGNITAELAPTDAAELLRQAEGEYNERLKEQNLTPVLHIDTESCSILADGRLLWRVFDNLLGNIVKYAMPGTRVYLELSRQAGRCLITIRNISKDELGIEAEELMERFVRGDLSRATEGSGLGLSIARSLTECMKGGFNLVLDGDLFKVVLDFPLV